MILDGRNVCLNIFSHFHLRMWEAFMFIKFICDNQMKTNKSFLVHNLLNSSWTVNNKTNTKKLSFNLNLIHYWTWFLKIYRTCINSIKIKAGNLFFLKNFKFKDTLMGGLKSSEKNSKSDASKWQTPLSPPFLWVKLILIFEKAWLTIVYILSDVLS